VGWWWNSFCSSWGRNKWVEALRWVVNTSPSIVELSDEIPKGNLLIIVVCHIY
jgi:hypothetical protein